MQAQITVADIARHMAKVRTTAYLPEIRTSVDQLAAHLTAHDPQMWDEYTTAIAAATARRASSSPCTRLPRTAAT
jgi:hypothetical protein